MLYRKQDILIRDIFTKASLKQFLWVTQVHVNIKVRKNKNSLWFNGFHLPSNHFCIVISQEQSLFT